MNPFFALERYARPKSSEVERCELCAATIPSEHPHVVELVSRKLCCACGPCAALFRDPAAGGGRYRTVPDRILLDEGFSVPVERWESLSIPVRLAFVFRNGSLGKWVGVYPSPGGPTEVILDGDPAELGESPLFRLVEDDVEALLFYGRRGAAALECLLGPIDRCYELVGLVRRRYRGFDGDEGREAIEEFFQGLRARARPVERGLS
jgi:hypothetical protein